MSMIKVRPDDLRMVSRELKLANKKNITNVKKRLGDCKAINADLGAKKTSRERRLCDEVYMVIDGAGVESMLSSFPSSYDLIEPGTFERTTLERILDSRPPESIRERVIARFGLQNRLGFRVNVGGGDSGAISAYRAIEGAYNTLKGQMDSNIKGIQGFTTTSMTKMYERTTTGLASDAIISIMNSIGDTAIDSFLGHGGPRTGKYDGCVKTLENVVDTAEQNSAICNAAIEELAIQSSAFADITEAVDNLAARSIANGTIAISDQQLPPSTVYLVIYRPEVLSDGSGFTTAREQQTEHRYENLHRDASNQLNGPANFVVSGSNRLVSDSERLAAMVDRWEVAISQPVTYHVLERHTLPSGSTEDRWRGPLNGGTVANYLPSGLANNIAAAQGVADRLSNGFSATASSTSQLAGVIGSGGLTAGVRNFVENAIFDTEEFARVLNYAERMRDDLTKASNALVSLENVIRGHMKGNTAMAYAGAIARVVKFLRANVDAIEWDFKGGGASSDRPKSFPTRIKTSIHTLLSRKTVEELLVWLLPNGELDWERLEQMLDNQAIDLTDIHLRPNLESLATILDRLMPPMSVYQYQVLAQIFGSLTDASEIEQFLHLMTVPFINDGLGDKTSFAMHQNRINRILEQGMGMIFDDIFNENPRSDEARHQLMQNMILMTAVSSTPSVIRGVDGNPALTVNSNYLPQLIVNLQYMNTMWDFGWPNLSAAASERAWQNHGFTVSNVRYGTTGNNSLHGVIHSIQSQFLEHLSTNGKSWSDSILTKFGDMIFSAAVASLKVVAIPAGKIALSSSEITFGTMDCPHKTRLRNELFAQFDRSSLGMHAQLFSLEAVAVWDSDHPTVAFFPTAETINEIERINSLIRRNQFDVDGFVRQFNEVRNIEMEFERELTLEHVLTFPAFAHSMFIYIQYGNFPHPDESLRR